MDKGVARIFVKGGRIVYERRVQARRRWASYGSGLGAQPPAGSRGSVPDRGLGGGAPGFFCQNKAPRTSLRASEAQKAKENYINK